MAASSKAVSIRCDFSHLGGCGKSNHYTNNKVDQIDNCTKDTTTHLNRLHSIDVSRANFPEQKDFWFYTEAVFFLLIVPQTVCQYVRGIETFLEFIGVKILLSVNSKDIQLAARQKLIEELHQPCPRNTGFWQRQLIPVGSGKSQIYKSLSVKINGIPFPGLSIEAGSRRFSPFI